MNRYFKGHRWMHLLAIGSMLLATLTFTTAAAAQSTCGATYTVKSGDTLSSIAKMCNVPFNSLVEANPQIANPNQLSAGEQISIPESTASDTGGSVYIVQPGDNLTSIAQRFGTTVNTLLQLNPQITDPSLIYPGEQIVLPSGIIPVTGGSVYIVQPGDNLTLIAQRLGTTVSALEKANPQITNPSLIYPGEQINLPAGIIPVTGSQPLVQISPLSGTAGTLVTVDGSGFPANTELNITVSAQSAASAPSTGVTTDSSGDFTAQVAMPADAQPGSTWIITAASQTSGGPSASIQFQVIAPVPNAPYTIQSGDTLGSIALRFGTTVNALLRANPQITNANQLVPGDQIYIPGSVVTLPSGQTVYIVKQGDNLSTIASDLGTSLNTLVQLNPQISNLSLIYPGQRINLPAGIIPVTGTQPLLEVNPLNGPAGSQVMVSGSGFPENTNLNLAVGPQSASPVITTTATTDAHGNFIDYVAIPNDAQDGSLWVITAATQTSGGPSAGTQFQVAAPVPNAPYTVKSGDTLNSIALHFGTTTDALLRANPQITNPSALTPGQQIYLPGSVVTLSIGQKVYIANQGDNLSGIAFNQGVSLSTLLKLNPQITNPSLIYPGERIALP
ncbi:MAG: LysM peptidoglycan-binding domain-containing protein [Anaerolineales bacterium]